MQALKRDCTGKIKPSTLSLEEQTLSTTIPFWKISYEEQVKEKSRLALKYIVKLCDLILTRNPNLQGYVTRQQATNNKLMCHVDPLVRTTNPNGYRAKCDFRVGIEEATNLRVVGFNVPKRGVLNVRPGDKMIQLPHQMKLAVKLFEDYIRLSPLPPYSMETRTGFWHHIGIRVTLAGEVMILVVINTKDLTDHQFQYVKSDLSNYFFNGEGRVANVQSLYYQKYDEYERKCPLSELELLGGSPRLVEPLMGIDFNLGPHTRFMSNMCAAQSWYQALCDLIHPNPNVTLVDICSGIGDIALTMAKKCREVYAMEKEEQHIADGVLTAQINGISNISFLHGNAEEQLGDLLRSLEGPTNDIVCVFDPPRLNHNKKRKVITDLAFRIVDQVRQCESVSRFVYICNNLKGPVRLFLDFCASPLERGSYKFVGLPFVPVRIIPFDLNPHTPHYQLLVLFERCWSSSSKRRLKKEAQTQNVYLHPQQQEPLLRHDNQTYY